MTRPPVAVLTYEQSGLDALRQLLDSHPDLACLAEGRIPGLCKRIFETWQEVERPGQRGPSSLALAQTRVMINTVLTPILAARGKLRWCDASAGSAPSAEFFDRVFPEARYICLHRSCTDVIYDAIKSNPWGITAGTFSFFAMAHAGNNVAALANYWATQTAAMLDFEETHPDRCWRVHYEDFAADPKATAGDLFSFLDCPDYPALATLGLFAPMELGAGAGGEKVPVEVLPAHLRIRVNDLLNRLGYPPIRSDEPQRGRVPAGP
ncbi:MAG TPA: sulfotransferase [Trebonia sp.]|nr:sulfotransferase [Trebonia sp.]